MCPNFPDLKKAEKSVAAGLQSAITGPLIFHSSTGLRNMIDKLTMTILVLKALLSLETLANISLIINASVTV